ncbi:AbrB family transcriptional regulator [Enterococcus mundtii]|uniref:AbrB family transcriptional regulator n=1 Tax=Enterococcus mundtii TaxID=53346 RepID=A0A2S7RTG9_ENTMU|nr:AbrB family transcriptional regulator [Enterococcus mundtii]PQF22979.1 AbrB family transcriptional regulator [Enterococcus mundtii]
MKSLKVRKIGNIVGIILPKELGLPKGDILSYMKEGTTLIIDTKEVMREQDRKEIEKAFTDFSKGLVVSESEMKDTFSKYGWGE